MTQSYKKKKLKAENEALGKIQSNPKYFYSFAKKSSKSSGQMGTLIGQKGELYSTSFDKSECLRKQYQSVFTEPDETFKIENPEAFFNIESPAEINEIKDIIIHASDVKEAIGRIPNGASPGPDGVLPCLLKRADNSIARMMTNIFRASYETGEIPDILKQALVSPIFKGGSTSSPPNWRPVCLTSHVGKTAERLVREKLVRHLEFMEKMDSCQHGSRKGRSTLSQLLEHHDEIVKILEKNENVDSIYTDFEKAFQKCDHGKMMHKLKSLGVTGKLARWIQSFLA